MSLALRIAGWLAILCGSVLLVSGLVADVSLESPARYDSVLGYSSPSRIVNYSLMFAALRDVVAGGFVALIGAVFVASGEILTRTASPTVAQPALLPTPLTGLDPVGAPLKTANAAGRTEGGRFDRAVGLAIIAVIGGIAVYALVLMSTADRTAALPAAGPVDAVTVDSGLALSDAAAAEAAAAAGSH